MKRTKNQAFVALLLLLIGAMILPLAACSGGIDRETADAFIEDFFAEIKKEDYGRAESFFHPDRFMDAKKYLDEVEKSCGIDFSNGIVVERRTEFIYSYYFGEVGGSRYGMTVDAAVGETAVTVEIMIVENDNGYGIYELRIR